MNMTSRLRNDPSVLANVMESDFLASHLQTLLIREPSTGSHSRNDDLTHTEDLILGSAFVSPPRRPSCSSSTPNNNSKRANREAATSTSSRIVKPMSPGDGIFNTVVSTAAVTPSSIQQGRIGADGYDYFDRRSASGSSSQQHHHHHHHYHQASPSSASITTNFGRRPLMKSRNSSTLINTRRTSQDQTQEDLSDASSVLLSSKDSMILGSYLEDRRASDGTNLTGVTSPLARSESACSLERDYGMKAEISMVEEEVNETEQPSPSTPYSPTTQLEDEAGDQTTWERFKRGAVIEPPETSSAPYSVSWVSGKVVSSRYTSLTTTRRSSSQSPGKDTVKAEGIQNAKDASNNAITLIPFGNDGRSFRFTSR